MRALDGKHLYTPPGPSAAHVGPPMGPALLSTPLTRRSALLGASSAAAAATMPTTAFAAASDVFFPAANSLNGTTIFITGANTGLGLESAKRLAAAGATIVVAARTKAKVDAAVKEITESSTEGSAVGVQLDLADLSSIKSLPARLKAALGTEMPTIDVLMNNAGVMAVPERVGTVDGFEKTVGINHLGHFALTAVLLPALQRAKAGFRIINLSSDAHRFVNRDAFAASLDEKLDPKEYAANGWGAYGVSKAANVLFTQELQERLQRAGVRGSAVSLHPGGVKTDLTRYVIGGVEADDQHPTQDLAPPSGPGALLKNIIIDRLSLPVDEGANTQVYLAAAADTGGDRTKAGGLYFDRMKAVQPADAASDSALAKRLWQVSEELTGAKIGL